MRRILCATALLGALLTTTARAEQTPGEMRALDRPFLELVGAIEAPHGYDAVTGFAPFPPEKPVTEMTIAEVMSWQGRVRDAGAESTAVGRFQFVLETLDFLTRAYEVPHDTALDRRTQDYLARILLHRCGFYDPEAAVPELGDCLAGTWAALPMLSDPKRGYSRYKGKANNHARTTPEVVEAVLAVRFAPDALSVAARGASQVGSGVGAFMADLSRRRVGTGAVITDAAFRN
jgi:hypothetical protein